MLIGISLLIEGQILGDRTIPASIASTIVGIAFLIAGKKAKKS